MNKQKMKWYQTTGGIIALIFLFFPAGLFLMWINPKWSKQTKWTITGIFAFLIFLGGIINTFDPNLGKDGATDSVAMTSPTSTPIPSPTPPQTLEGKIKAQLGDGESMSTEDATDLDTNQPIVGKKQIDLILNLGSDQWDINMARERVWARTATLSKGIFPLDNSIYAIQVTGNVPTTDAYGKTQQTELALVTITRDTYNKIQWDNFDYHNIPTVADTYYEDKNIK